MSLLHRKKIDIYANISIFLSYYEVTVATRFSPYPEITNHYKSPYTVPQPAVWMCIFLHMYSICEAFAQLYSLYFFKFIYR